MNESEEISWMKVGLDLAELQNTQYIPKAFTLISEEFCMVSWTVWPLLKRKKSELALDDEL